MSSPAHPCAHRPAANAAAARRAKTRPATEFPAQPTLQCHSHSTRAPARSAAPAFAAALPLRRSTRTTAVPHPYRAPSLPAVCRSDACAPAAASRPLRCAHPRTGGIRQFPSPRQSCPRPNTPAQAAQHRPRPRPRSRPPRAPAKPAARTPRTRWAARGSAGSADRRTRAGNRHTWGRPPLKSAAGRTESAG